MTYLGRATLPSVFSAYHRPIATIRRGMPKSARKVCADEDGAREALGIDPHVASVVGSGVSIEHLARIALG